MTPRHATSSKENTMLIHRIRRYRRHHSAKRFADTLSDRFPHRRFDVRQHPYDFGWAIREVTSCAWIIR
jgi:hypothetical protein